MLSIQNTDTTNTFDFWRERTNDLAHAMSICVVTTNANTSSTSATGNAAITGTFTASNGFICSNTGTYYVGNSIANAILTSSTFKVGNTFSNVTISSNVVNLANTFLYVTTSDSTTTNTFINSSSVVLSNSTCNVAIKIPTSQQISEKSYFLNANGSWSSIDSISLISKGNVGSVAFPVGGDQTIDSYDITKFRGAEYLVNVNDLSGGQRYIAKILTMHNTTEAYMTEYAQIYSNNPFGYFRVRIASGNLLLDFIPLTSSYSATFTRIMVPL
jgi:hypothetical protein